MDKIDQLLNSRQEAEIQIEQLKTPVTVLFTDIKDSTAFFETHGDVEGLAMVHRHNTLLFPVVERYHGEVVKTVGDAIMARFDDPRNALRAAIAMQQALRKDNEGRPGAKQIHIRIGIHSGKGIIKNNDVYGDVVNTAARVEHEAKPGEIYISESLTVTARTLGATTGDAGETDLKGKAERVRLLTVDWQAFTTPDLAPAPQRRVGAYVLLEKIGAGGLGEVWKARDPRLDRVVALKFILPDRLQSIKDLLREARTAAALNHPNIVTVLEVGESDDAAYIAMEFVEGESLRQRMTRSRLPLDAAVDIVIQVARGLGAAHQHGTVHRDVKPENVMIRVDGYVKVVDFGVAKVLPWSDAEATAGSTETGQLAGTFNYMSPEQARGQKITSASDIFSLGILFYELLTGEHPFKTDNTMDTLQRILSAEPVSTRTRCPELPDEVHEVVLKCLEKDPAKRFARAGEIEERLGRARTAPPARSKTPRRWPAAAATLLIALMLFSSVWFFWPASTASFVTVRSIAVMNFRSAPNDAGAAQLAQGLPEDLGAALSNQGFLVASRSGVLALEGLVTTKRVASELAVEGVVEGTVSMLGNNLRVHVELASGQTGFQIWNRTFAVDPQNLLDGGAGVSAEIAEQIRKAVTNGR